MSDQSKNWDSLSTEQRQIIDNALVSDVLLESVLSQINLGENETVYRDFLFASLKSRTQDRLISAIWEELDAEQINSLHTFIKVTQKDAPWMDNNSTLMEFVTLYPELMARIFKKLSKFFREFIAETNRILAS